MKLSVCLVAVITQSGVRVGARVGRAEAVWLGTELASSPLSVCSDTTAGPRLLRLSRQAPFLARAALAPCGAASRSQRGWPCEPQAGALARGMQAAHSRSSVHGVHPAAGARNCAGGPRRWGPDSPSPPVRLAGPPSSRGRSSCLVGPQAWLTQHVAQITPARGVVLLFRIPSQGHRSQPDCLSYAILWGFF